jgi:serine phosphatase RsbU (regulator of sigma subunit)
MSQRGALTADAKFELLLQISQRISGTLDLDEILAHLLDAVRGVLHYDAAGIFALTRDAPFVRPPAGRQLIAGMASRGFPPLSVEQDAMLRFGQGIVGHVIRTGESIVAPDVRLDARYVIGRPRTLSEIAVPIVVDRRTIGALNLESDALAAYGADDLETLRFFADAAAISISKAMLHRHVLEKQRLEEQLHIAHEVQTRLLPSAAPSMPGYDIAGLSIPTYEIGGDYFDYLFAGDARLGVVVADVAGKGIPAALIMATFRAFLRTHARPDAPPADVADAANRFLIASSGLPGFVTAVYGVLDPAEGRFSYANCGHNPPLLVRENGQAEALTTGGPFLGVHEPAVFGTGEALLEPGDLLLLFTDGVVDVAGQEGAEFGTERLITLAHARRDLPAMDLLHEIVRATREYAGVDAYQDDFTLLVIRRQGDEAAEGYAA